MNAITIRLDSKLYNEIVKRANKENRSLNKTISIMLTEAAYSINELISSVQEINKIVNDLEESIDAISRRQSKHFLVTKQHFVNEGYLSNAEINEDKRLKELLNRNAKFHD